MYKLENLEIARSALSKFDLKKFQSAVVSFHDINTISIIGCMTSPEVYALSKMVSESLLEKDGTLEPFKL